MIYKIFVDTHLHSLYLTIFFTTLSTEQLHSSILRDAVRAQTPTNAAHKITYISIKIKQIERSGSSQGFFVSSNVSRRKRIGRGQRKIPLIVTFVFALKRLTASRISPTIRKSRVIAPCNYACIRSTSFLGVS